MLTAFNLAKNSLSTMAELSHPSPQAKLALVADPSATHGGATLYQQRNPGGPWEPLGFFSKKLNNAQVSYRAFNRELLAAFSAMRHLRFQVEGHPFQLWTDHRPLTFALGHFSDAWTPHQQWQLSYITEYTSHIGTPTNVRTTNVGNDKQL